MPSVPRAKRQVGLEPLPNARVSGEAPLEAFGGGQGLENIAAGARETAKTVQKLVAEQQYNADYLATQDADLKLSQLETDLQTKAESMYGKNALEAPDTVKTDWEKGVAEIRKGLKNDRQRAMFVPKLTKRTMTLNKSVQSHVSKEYVKYDVSSTNDFVVNARNEAVRNYEDLGRVASSIQDQIGAIKRLGSNYGFPEETIKKNISEAVSATHVDVINRMLADANSDRARAYSKSVKGQINPDDMKRISSDIDRVDLTVQANMVASEIIAKYPEDNVGIEQAILSIKDTKTREEVQKQVTVQIRQQNAAYNKTESENAAKIAGSNGVPYTLHDLENEKAGLSKNYYRIAKDSLSQVTGELNSSKYISFVERYGAILAQDDVSKQNEEMRKFRMDILANKSNFDEANFQKLLSWTTDDFVAEQTPKANPIMAAIKYISGYFSSAGNPVGNVAQTTARFLSRAMDPATKPEDIPVVAQQTVKSDALAANPEFVGREDVSNTKTNKASDITRVYHGTTTIKPDFQLAGARLKPAIGDTVPGADGNYYEVTGFDEATGKTKVKRVAVAK